MYGHLKQPCFDCVCFDHHRTALTCTHSKQNTRAQRTIFIAFVHILRDKKTTHPFVCAVSTATQQQHSNNNSIQSVCKHAQCSHSTCCVVFVISFDRFVLLLFCFFLSFLLHLFPFRRCSVLCVS